MAGLRQTVAPGAASLVTCHPPPCTTPPQPPAPPPHLPAARPRPPRPGHAARLSPGCATPHPLTNITGLSLCNVLTLPRRGTYQSLPFKSKTLQNLLNELYSFKRVSLMNYISTESFLIFYINNSEKFLPTTVV